MTERLSQFLKAEQLTAANFADQIGVQRAGVSHILSGRNKPGCDFLEKFIKRFPAVNIEWFITGKGKMYKEQVMPELFGTPADIQPRLSGTSEEPEPPVATTPLPPYCTKAATQLPDEAMEKNIEKVIILYSDNTFSAYSPNPSSL
ncbi:MAG: helix-turn-helix domain-containing protein [Prevotellaceae bacterium]|jgi:transcriptional regulator with XRE-family HTH domain|nr:helix-turn-helix domain-containing protein [Prevotellaceae bacterium]